MFQNPSEAVFPVCSRSVPAHPRRKARGSVCEYVVIMGVIPDLYNYLFPVFPVFPVKTSFVM